MALSLVLSIPAVSFANNDLDKIQILKSDNGNLKMEEIPEETKLKVKELKEKLKTGEITKEQFHEEMKKLFPDKPECNEDGHKKELPEETKAKLGKFNIPLHSKPRSSVISKR